MTKGNQYAHMFNNSEFSYNVTPGQGQGDLKKSKTGGLWNSQMYAELS